MLSTGLEPILPPRVTLTVANDHLAIGYRRLSSATGVLVPFVVLWNANVVRLADLALASPSTLLSLFALLNLAAGLALAYCTVAACLNRTVIVVERQRVSIRHRPLPWFGRMEIDASRLVRLYSIERNHAERRFGDPAVPYQVNAVLVDGRNVTLIRGLETSEQAHFIERRLERHLHPQLPALPAPANQRTAA